MSPILYARAGDRFLFAKCSCEAWAAFMLVCSRLVIFSIFLTKSFPSLLRIISPFSAVLCIGRGGPKLILGWKPVFAKNGEILVDSLITFRIANSASGSYSSQLSLVKSTY